jgi:hypothetical protein
VRFDKGFMFFFFKKKCSLAASLFVAVVPFLKVSLMFIFVCYLSESGYIRDGAAIGFNPQDLRARITRGSAFDHRAGRVGKVDAVGWLLQENRSGQRRRTGRRCRGTVANARTYQS